MMIDAAPDLLCEEELGIPQAPDLGRLDSDLTEWRSMLGWTGQSVPCERKPIGSRQKIVVISDPHCPYLDENALRTCIQRDAADADLCVVTGDVANLGAFSSFPKYVYEPPAVEQFRSVQKFLIALNESFPRVEVMGGNHDARQLNYLVRTKEVAPDILDLFRQIAPGALNLLIPAVAELDNVKLVGSAEYQDAKFTFFHQVGDIVFGHAEVYSKIGGRAVHNFAHWLKSLAEPYNLVKPFRVVCQGHTHQQCSVAGDYGLRLYELGCMTRFPDYAGNPKLRGAPRPWWVGYHVFVQYNGVTDLNESYAVDLSPWRQRVH